MPVIRGPSRTDGLSADRRNALVDRLLQEIAGRGTPYGPLIYEIPLDQQGMIDVLVVWQDWENVRSEDRTSVILEAYHDQQPRIAQALGVTYQEAMEQHLLPYAVVPMTRQGEADSDQLLTLMLNEGGIPLPGGKVDLRFPTARMAESAHHNLCKKLPEGYWSIVQTVGPVS